MAFAHDAHGMDQGRGFGLGLAIHNLRDALQRHKVYRQTLRELKTLSSRELQDLGINRSLIRRVALDAAYGSKQ